MRAVVVGILLWSLLPAVAHAQPDPLAVGAERLAAADRYLGTDRQQSFADYVSFITDVHAVSEAAMRRLGVPWTQALENGRRRFRAARSVEDVYYALLSVQRTLRDGHGRFVPNGLPVSFGPPVALDFDAVALYAGPAGGVHQYVVTRSGEDALPVGSVITGLAGRDLGAIEAELLEWYDRHTPEGFHDFVARSLSFRKPQSMPCPRPGDRAAVTCRDPDGAVRVAELTWRIVTANDGGDPAANGSSEASLVPPGKREPARFDAQYRDFPLEASGLFFGIYGTRSADTKILRYVSFNYESEADFPPEIAAISAHLQQAGARRVLVDVRENAGGAFDPALIGVFTSRPFRLMLKSFHYGRRIKAHPEALRLDTNLELWTEDEARLLQDDLAAHPSATWSRPIPFFCRTAACDEDESVLRFDGSPGYETVVLCGPQTFSSGDMFVTIMKDNGLARLAGMPSGAGDAPYRWTLDYPLADGTKVTLRLTTAVSYRPNSDGLTIEGNPPPLDVPVFPTRANAGALLDSVLVAAGWQ